MCSNSAGLQQRGLRAPYLQREILASSIRCIRAVERTRARCAHGVAPAAASHAAHQPLARMLPRRRRVAHAAHDVSAAAATKRHERMTLRALRRVVDVLGAHAPVLVKPLRGEVDGARLRGRRLLGRRGGAGGWGDVHRDHKITGIIDAKMKANGNIFLLFEIFRGSCRNDVMKGPRGCFFSAWRDSEVMRLSSSSGSGGHRCAAPRNKNQKTKATEKWATPYYCCSCGFRSKNQFDSALINLTQNIHAIFFKDKTI